MTNGAILEQKKKSLSPERASEKWLPHSITWYEGKISQVIKNTVTVKNAYKIKKNICYNLQYLEYLDQTLQQLKLTEVLIGQTFKSYVITSASVIEAVFYYLAKKHEKNLKPEWVEDDRDTTNLKDKGDGTPPTRKVVLTEKLIHLEIKQDIKFNNLSRRVENNKLLGDTSIYAKIKTLRDLRNSIHLFSSGDPQQLDTDYNIFNKSQYLFAKEMLSEVLLRTEMYTKEQLIEIGLIKQERPE